MDDLKLEPVRQSILSDHVYAQLSEAIISGKLKPGQHLTEQSLASQLQVSRIAIREAIHSLAMEGLVRVYPRRGAYVINLTTDDILEIYQLRAAIEKMAVELAVKNLTPEWISALENIIEEMKQPANIQDRLISSRLDTQFHQTIMTISGHTRGIKIWTQMSRQIQMVLYTVSNYYRDYPHIASWHQQTLNILIEGDARKASENIHSHVMEGAYRLLEFLDK
ncbi:MAG: GntR family transcriptional regulator [Anaerolineae bacterium]|nr:GntR family transcriptional regulator [Anaerolineae bacterium]